MNLIEWIIEERVKQINKHLEPGKRSYLETRSQVLDEINNMSNLDILNVISSYLEKTDATI